MNESSNITYEEHLHLKLKPEWISIVYLMWLKSQREREDWNIKQNILCRSFANSHQRSLQVIFYDTMKICQFLFDFSITHIYVYRLQEMLILKCLCVLEVLFKIQSDTLHVHSSIWSSCLGVNNSITNWIIIHSSFHWSSFLSHCW